MRFGRAQSVILAISTMAALAYTVIPYSPASEIVLYDGVVALAFAGSLLGLRRVWSTNRLPWLLTSLCLAGFLASELIWWSYNLRGIDPFPSLADVVSLSSYVPLALATAALAATSQREPDRAAWLDAGILTAVVGLVMWAPVMEPIVNDPSVSAFEKTFAIGYPLADIVVLGFVLRMILSRNARTRASVLLTAGVAATLIADIAFNVLDSSDSYTPSSWVDAAWMIGYALLGAAALDSSAAYRPSAAETAGLRRGRLAVVLAAVLVPQTVLFAALADDAELGWTTSTIAAGVSTFVLTLVALRLWTLVGRARRVEVRRSSDRLSALIHHSSDAVVLIGRDRTISYASPAVASLWGLSPERLIGSDLIGWIANDDRIALGHELLDLANMSAGTIVGIDAHITSNGTERRIIEGTARNLLDDDAVSAIVVTIRDVTERRNLEAQLERQAFHDDLTGLANRALFSDRVAHALERSRRTPHATLAVLFIDLDDFKAVNDGMGHGAGDELLQQVAVRITSCLRPADTVARLGGDEFAVLAEDLDSVEQATALAARILEMLRLPMPVLDADIAVPASIGIALQSPDSTVTTILRDADIAMYSAKSKGKGRYEIFDDALRDAAQRHLALRIELPQALGDGQLRLVYQPIFSVRSRQLSGFEALLRWDHPTRGLVSPLEFIPAAEESGAIIDIGRWVVAEACRQAASWNASANDETNGQPNLTMSVNVSAVQIHSPGFVDDITTILRSTGLPPELLVVELTESVLIDADRVIPILEALRAVGVGIAIDDFGTGYSSLSYLQRLPVTSVKIDRAFVTDLVDAHDAGMVRTILAMAEALGLATVAEGVETADQLTALDSLDCDSIQGYYLGHPAAPDDLAAMIDASREGRTTTIH